MSAEKPEVGDVWEDSKGMVHISRIFTLSDDTRAIVFIDNNNNTVLEDSAREEHFIKMFTYSGKSKASIEDLFCVKENAKNDTQTDLRTIGELQAEINRLRKALEYYADESNYAQFKPCGYEIAQKALKKIGFEK